MRVARAGSTGQGNTGSRFVTLSDGQVLDREYKPDVRLTGWTIQAIRASNRADAFLR